MDKQQIPNKLFFKIGEVCEITDTQPYVLRYWESEFKLLRPKKNPAGQRVYRKRDLELVQRIRTLLYDERLTLEGAKKRLLAESRRGPEQLQLGLKEAAYTGALRRIRDPVPFLVQDGGENLPLPLFVVHYQDAASHRSPSFNCYLYFSLSCLLPAKKR